MAEEQRRGGRRAFLQAFDRLFDSALKRLHAECTPEERQQARRDFEEHFAPAFEIIDRHLGTIDFPDEILNEMQTAIAGLPAAELARLMASAPLAEQLQAAMRFIAAKVAEQRLLEYALSQADSKYGGN